LLEVETEVGVQVEIVHEGKVLVEVNSEDDTQHEVEFSFNMIFRLRLNLNLGLGSRLRLDLDVAYKLRRESLGYSLRFGFELGLTLKSFKLMLGFCFG
jgi:hypothetical protein